MSKGKATEEEKAAVAKACAEGLISQAEAARRAGVAKATVQEWIARYKVQGTLTFREQEHNTVYSDELKNQAVTEYLRGNLSLNNVAAKYGLRSKVQLRRWIKVYNSGKNFSHKMSGGSRMKQGRETTQEERIVIARECLENDGNYGEIAIKHSVSYQQAYTWTRKYKALGEAGLEDRRGKKTAAQEPRTELEKAQIEIAKLKHELYMTRMERDLLKKLDELERRDAFRK